MKNIYAFRNRKISSYGDPFFTELEKENVVKTLSKKCILDPDTCKKQFYHESEVYLLGSFDDDSGKFELFQSPEFLVDLGQFFEKETN